MKVYIGDITFGTFDLTAKYLLEGAGVELVDCLRDAEGVIAGTESYNADVLSLTEDLRVISRMGVGFDNVDLGYCEEHRISVTYTPEAPAGSVAELIIAQMLNMIRFLPQMNICIGEGSWARPLGKKISELKIGLIGIGRIGKRVIKRLQPFKPNEIYAYDINNAMVTSYWAESNFEFLPINSLEYVLKNSDIVSVSVPMNKCNYHMINKDFLLRMKDESYLINTSRGDILDEKALEYVLKTYHNKLQGVALDVFSNEPYTGNLTKFDLVLMTPHIGSMTLSTRIDMETQAAKDCMNVLNGNPPAPGNLVPFEKGNICEHA